MRVAATSPDSLPPDLSGQVPQRTLGASSAQCLAKVNPWSLCRPISGHVSLAPLPVLAAHASPPARGARCVLVAGAGRACPPARLSLGPALAGCASSLPRLTLGPLAPGLSGLVPTIRREPCVLAAAFCAVAHPHSQRSVAMCPGADLKVNTQRSHLQRRLHLQGVPLSPSCHAVWLRAARAPADPGDAVAACGGKGSSDNLSPSRWPGFPLGPRNAALLAGRPPPSRWPVTRRGSAGGTFRCLASSARPRICRRQQAGEGGSVCWRPAQAPHVNLEESAADACRCPPPGACDGLAAATADTSKRPVRAAAGLRKRPAAPASHLRGGGEPEVGTSRASRIPPPLSKTRASPTGRRIAPAMPLHAAHGAPALPNDKVFRFSPAPPLNASPCGPPLPQFVSIFAAGSRSPSASGAHSRPWPACVGPRGPT